MAGVDLNVIILGAASLGAVAVFFAWSRGGGDNPYVADRLMSEGLLFKQQSDYIQAEMKLEKALAELQSAKTPDLSKTVSCSVALASVYESNGKHELARELFKGVMANWKTQLARNQLSVVDIDYAVSNLDFGRGTYDVAVFYIDSIVVARERSLPQGHTDILNSHKIGANLLRKAGYNGEADELEARGKN